MPDSQGWYTMQEIADLLGVHYSRVRNAVATLTKLGSINTRANPLDNRVIQIHPDDVEKIRRAVFGQ